MVNIENVYVVVMPDKGADKLAIADATSEVFKRVSEAATSSPTRDKPSAPE